MPSLVAASPFGLRFRQYLAERFPLAAHGPLVAAFGLGVCAFGAQGWPGTGRWLAASAVVLGAFFQLRVADEHKDAAVDAAARPERPVPRGLVTLAELRHVALGVAAVQAGLAAWLGPATFAALGLVWFVGALMTAEFGVPAWLRARPGVYLLSHLAILPALDLVTLTAGAAGADLPPRWLAPLAMAYAGAGVLEIGRKLRAPTDERPGVETYTAAWGVPRALAAWGAFGLVSLAALAPVAHRLAWGFAAVVAVGLAVVAARAVLRPTASRLAAVERVSGLWLLVQYGALAASALVR